MPAKTLTFLKTLNRDYNNVLDSMFNVLDNTTVTGTTTFSSDVTLNGGTKLTGNVTMSGATRLAAATTVAGETTFEGITKLTGATTMSGNAKFTGQTVINQSFAVLSGSASAVQNAFVGNEGTLVEAIHSGKTLLCPDAKSDCVLTIPRPSKAGITYKLVYHGVADDAHDIVITFPDDQCYFKGSVLTLDENEAGASQTATIFANGSTHDKLTINDPHYYCIEMVSLSATVMVVWGTIISDTVAAFGAND